MGETEFVAWDVIRLLHCTAALLLAALVLRMCWVRYQAGTPMLHPAVYMSFALALLLMAGQRIGHIGESPATPDLYVAIAVVVLGWYGVLRRAKLAPIPGVRR